jgi:hypothetical protein
MTLARHGSVENAMASRKNERKLVKNRKTTLDGGRIFL